MTFCEFFKSQTFRGKDQILICYSAFWINTKLLYCCWFCFKYDNGYKVSTSASVICLKYVILLSLDNELKENVETFSNNCVAWECAADFFWTAEGSY